MFYYPNEYAFILQFSCAALYLTSKTLRSVQTYTVLQYTRQYLEGIDKSSNVENLEKTLHNSVKSVTAFGLLLSKYIHRYCNRDEHKLFLKCITLIQLLQLARTPLKNIQVVVSMSSGIDK